MTVMRLCRPPQRRRSRRSFPLFPLVAAFLSRSFLPSAPTSASLSFLPFASAEQAATAASASASSASSSAGHAIPPSRAYPTGCLDRPPSYYDYDNYPFPPTHRPELIRDVEEFWLLRRLGAGKFSDVFEAVDVKFGGNGGGGVANAEDERVVDPKSLVVIKCLKPVSERKVRRELLVLSHASDLPNLARLRGVVIPDDDDGDGGEYGGKATGRAKKQQHRAAHRMPSLILEHAGPDSRWLCHGPGVDAGRQAADALSGNGRNKGEDYHLSEYEIKYYLYHLLVALDALHSRGIMHRDVKPRNVLINRKFTAGPSNGATHDPAPDQSGNGNGDDDDDELRPVVLIDLGLADFYHPQTPYNVRVASRHYKSPELLVGVEHYDYSIDLWGVGCVLAGLLLRREPFFRGRDNADQLGKIAGVLGEGDLREYCGRYDCPLSGELRAAVAKYSRSAARSGGNGNRSGAGATGNNLGRRSWLSLLPRDAPVPSREGLDLLDRLLVYDHGERWTAREAMDHPFFDEVRGRVKEELLRRRVKELQRGGQRR